MLNISRLLSGSEVEGDFMRYSRNCWGYRDGVAAGYGPVVVWNMTRRCNLNCLHCYAEAGPERWDGSELNFDEACRFIDDLVEFHVPMLLLSGGEPLLRPDFFELAGYAVKRGLRVAVSTNGTLITPEVAREMVKIGVSYVGISLDGPEEINDRFRGQKGAFKAAIDGVRWCRAAGQKVGLRFTISRYNYDYISYIFELVEEECIPRVCFYHLVYSGRGSSLQDEDITRSETRAAMDLIVEKTRHLLSKGRRVEVLTVDNHADAVYLYMKVREKDPLQAGRIFELLRFNGGNRSGIAICGVDWNGDVHPDQFTHQYTLGNVRERKFGAIWSDISHPILRGLKDRKSLLKGRCRRCRWLELCNGNFRTRAEAVYGDFWAPDPACYLTDEEIS